MTQIQVVGLLYPLLRWLLPKWSRRRVYFAACAAGEKVHSWSWPLRDPVRWWAMRRLLWRHRRVLRLARRGIFAVEA